MIPIKTALNKIPPKRLYLGSMLLLLGSYYLYNLLSVQCIGYFLDDSNAHLFQTLISTGSTLSILAWSIVLALMLCTLIIKEGESNSTTIISHLKRITLIVWSCVFLTSLIQPESLLKIIMGKNYPLIAPYLWQYLLGVFLFSVSNVISYYFILLRQFVPLLFSLIIGVLQISVLTLFHDGLGIVAHVQVMAMSTLFVFQALYAGYQSSNLNRV